LIIRITQDVTECPACSNPVTKTGIADRMCNTCGLQWTLDTEEIRAMHADLRAVTKRDHAVKVMGERTIGVGKW
jgi:hypothetical protein